MGEITQHDGSVSPTGNAPRLSGHPQPISGREVRLGGALGARKQAAERMAVVSQLPEMRYLIRPGGEIATVQKHLTAFPPAGREPIALQTIVDAPRDYPYFSLGYQEGLTAPFRPILDISMRDSGLTVHAARTPAGRQIPSVDQQLMNMYYAKAMAAHMKVGLVIEIGERPEDYQLLAGLAAAEGSTTIPEASSFSYTPDQLADYAQQRLNI